MDQFQDDVCRILVVGAKQPGVIKIASVLEENKAKFATSLEIATTKIEYIPCVAKFGAYLDEEGKKVKYLVSVDYYGPNGSQVNPESLLPFFDSVISPSDEDEGSTEGPLFHAHVEGAALGGGIEDDDDVDQIATFLKTISNNRRIEIACVKPNSEFQSMHEEMAAFKALDADAKDEVIRSMKMGPGKVAKVAHDLACKIIKAKLDQRNRIREESLAIQATISETCAEEKEAEPRIIDPKKDRFSCRRCRMILFGVEDFENPPHEPSKHKFSYRKQNHGHAGSASAADTCMSYFLQTGLKWMGDLGDAEGKLGCPYCECKLGSYHWAGTQCSCGTWIVPAIQIPKSKVDILPPQPDVMEAELPAGTTVSGLVQIQELHSESPHQPREELQSVSG